MVTILLVSLLILVIVLSIASTIYFYIKFKSSKQAFVTSVIDIYANGKSHVEILPTTGTHPVDLVQLALSYVINVLFITWEDDAVHKQALSLLFTVLEKHYSHFNEAEYRRQLSGLSQNLPASLRSDGNFTVGSSEQFKVKFLRGKNFDHCIAKFSIRGYKPNVSNSALLLYAKIVEELDSTHLSLLQESIAVTLLYFNENPPRSNNHQIVAYTFLEKTINSSFRTIDVPLERTARKE